MFSKILIQFLCLSIALVQIKAIVRQTENDNEIRVPETEEDLEQRHGHHHDRHHKCRHHHNRHSETENEISYENREPEPEEDLGNNLEQGRRHHHHDRHHKCRHHRIEGEFEKPEHFAPGRAPHGHVPPPPPSHEMLIRMWPLFEKLLNKKYKKDSGMSITDDSKLEAASKARAYVSTKFQTKYTETLVDNNMNSNESKVLTKVLEQNGESDAILDFNSDMDVIRDKTLKAKSEEESKPVEKTQHEPLRKVGHGQNYRTASNHHLRRMKREADDESKKTWKSIGDAFNTIAQGAKKLYDDHVKKPIEDFAKKVKSKLEEMKKKHGDKKGNKGTEEQGTEDQGTNDQATEAPEHHDGEHEEK